MRLLDVALTTGLVTIVLSTTFVLTRNHLRHDAGDVSQLKLGETFDVDEFSDGLGTEGYAKIHYMKGWWRVDGVVAEIADGCGQRWTVGQSYSIAALDGNAFHAQIVGISGADDQGYLVDVDAARTDGCVKTMLFEGSQLASLKIMISSSATLRAEASSHADAVAVRTRAKVSEIRRISYGITAKTQ